MKFTKMHGIGNDYVYVNCFKETVKDPSAVAKFVSDRHFGIGSDGLILIKPSDIADCEMDMYNLDGSQGAMCGNGIRCVAKYAYELAALFHHFYRECRILGVDAKTTEARLGLITAVQYVLAHALAILGVSAPEHM